MSSDSLSIPAASAEQRDADGRLVGLVIDGPGLVSAQTGDTWLVPLDGSIHGKRALDEATRLTRDVGGGALQLANVQPWLSKEAAENELARRAWEASAAARAQLDAQAVPWRLHVAMGDTAESIVALASRLGCRGIVIGSRGMGTAETLLIGSVAYKVIHLSQVPVMVVR